MITLELVKYIEAQINKNTPKEIIIKNLSDSGWHIDDIEEGFSKAFPTPVEKVTSPVEVAAPVENKIEIQPTEIGDPYRELPDIDNNLPNIVSKNIQEAVNPDQPKVWVPMTVNSTPVEVAPEIKTETPKIEIQPISLNDIIKPSESITSDELSLENQINNNDSEINNNTPQVQEPVVSSYAAPSLSAFSFNQNKKSFSDFKPKVDSDISSSSSEKDLSARKPIVQVNTPAAVAPVISQPSIQETQTQSSPILSSLKQDMISSFNKNDQITVSPDNTDNRKKFKTIAIILATILIIGGLVFAFIGGYIKLPFSFIKTDPRVALLSSTASFDNLKSYKTNTTISLSSPSFANITSGLVNGEAVVSNDRDSISVDTKGLINRVSSSSTVSDYNSVIKSSFLKDDILTDIKYDGTTSYISVPDLSSSLEGSYPSASTVAVANGQFGLITPELPTYLQDKITKLDAFNILSNIMSTSFSGKFSSSFKDFINSATIVEKNSEIINGQNTYHYEINVDKTNTKKFLVSLMNTFANTISADVKSSLEESLGSANVDSFEVWIGANDSNIVQYKFTLSAPLSKIIGLDDKGIADNTVKLDWQTTYSDFNVANEIIMPTDYVKAEDYIKNINDSKIKNILSTFSSSAKTLFNAEGSYGKHLNKSGSCLSPDSGSLFSPLGHTAGASTAVSVISGKMNDLLSLTSGVGSCYSTLNAWSLSAPLVSNPQTYLCADSTGNMSTLSVQPNSVSCTAPVITQPVVAAPVTTTSTKTTKTTSTTKAPMIPVNSDLSNIVPPLPTVK